MTISLSREAEQIIGEKLAGGRYHSTDEVIMEGLRLLDEREYKQEIQRKIAAGLKSIEEGKVIPGEQVFAMLRERLKRYEKGAQNP